MARTDKANDIREGKGAKSESMNRGKHEKKERVFGLASA